MDNAKKAIVQECEKYKAQLEKSGTKYKILSEKTMKMVLFFQEFVVKMWSNQENRVRKRMLCHAQLGKEFPRCRAVAL